MSEEGGLSSLAQGQTRLGTIPSPCTYLAIQSKQEKHVLFNRLSGKWSSADQAADRC